MRKLFLSAERKTSSIPQKSDTNESARSIVELPRYWYPPPKSVSVKVKMSEIVFVAESEERILNELMRGIIFAVNAVVMSAAITSELGRENPQCVMPAGSRYVVGGTITLIITVAMT